MTKKILSAVVALALALVVVAPVAASADTTVITTTTSAYTFSSSLTVGSRGADVVALQSFLESKGLLTMPSGVAKGYFGVLTRSAVSAYQALKGITPTAGYFGQITRQAVQADMAAGGTTTVITTPGCPAGAMFNSINGAPCTTTTPVAGCPAGALYNSMTGAACTTTVVSSGAGIEGTLDVRLASNPSDNSNIRTQTDIPVYGLEFRSRIGDVSVQTVDLQVSVIPTAGSSENPSTLINTIKVWDGTTLLASVPVGFSTFTKDQNQVYYYRLSGLNFLVPKDATKVLTFSFSTNSIDTDRAVVITGYGSASVRAVSGNNISSFYNASALTRSHTFKKPGTSTLTLSAAGNTLRSQNYRVNGNDTLMGVTLATFNLKSQSGDSTLLTVNASTTASGTAPTTLYLYNGSTLLKSKTVSGTSISFDNLDTTSGSKVAQSDTPTTFTIKGDFPSNTANGTFASTTVNTVAFQTPNGNTSLASGSAVTNANQYVYTKAAVITLAGTPTITASNASVSGGTSTVTAVFPISICAAGGNVVVPGVSNGDAIVTFSNGVAATTANTVFTVIPANDISDGSCTTSATITAKSVGFAAGLYNAALTTIKWNAGNGTTTQTYGLDDFKTSSPANQQ